MRTTIYFFLILVIHVRQNCTYCMSNINKKKDLWNIHKSFWKTGNVLFSQLTAKQVSSALKVLTSVFGMCTGVSLSLLSPVMVECLLVHSQLHNV